MGFGKFRQGMDYYPKESMIDSAQWMQIEDYVLSLAPDSIPNIPDRAGRNSKLSQFTSSLQILDNPKISGAIVNVSYDALKNNLFTANVYGQVGEWKNQFPITNHFNSPVVSTILKKDTLYLTEIGIMNPSETARGAVYAMHQDILTPLVTNLHRPVYTEINDLNEDGKNEIIICEFGNYTGELSMLTQKDSIFEKRTLLALPGSIKVEVVDMNNDGKKDIVALFSQASEGIYIFYQKENLQFENVQVIRLPPEYGSSWFSLVDYDNNGLLDIVLVNGDNADYSKFLKPYHGIRLFMNEDNNIFEQQWFYPINGATRVMVEDFDLDGDFDFAVSAFFPDFESVPEEGFIYLENKNPDHFSFVAHTTEKAASGNWLVMDKGDFDQDGDVDLMLGNFQLLTSNKLQEGAKQDLLYLENNAIGN